MRSASPTPTRSAPASAANAAAAGTVPVPDPPMMPTRLPAARYREAELEQHPGSVLFPGGGAIEAEDAQASGHEEEHHHGEAAHDELGVADRGQGEHGRGTDRQDCHASSLAPHEE